MGLRAKTTGRLEVFHARVQARLSERAPRRSMALLLIQCALLLLLAAILILVAFVNQGERQIEYAGLVLALALIVIVAARYNLTARYKTSAWITMIGMAVGPWASILLDPNVLRGDIIPLVYVVLSIHLCATFLNEWATAAISLVQLTAVTALLLTNPNYASLNRPSFCAYIFCASALSIATSFIARKQVERIEEQNRALKESEERLLVLSTRDPLTGLFNRRYMEETLARETARVLRKNQPLSLMMADVNDFKEINDTYGHLAGDHVLCFIAETMMDCTRKSDVVCRFGGDEFVLVFPECSREIALSRRNLIMDRLALKKIEYAGSTIGYVTMSFGAASLPEDGETGEALLRAADAALYAAKKLKPSRYRA